MVRRALRAILLCSAFLLAQNAKAESVSLEIGGGAGWIDHTFVERLGKDALRKESLYSLPVALYGSSQIRRSTPGGYHLLLQSRSNDLAFNLFSRSNYWNTTQRVSSVDSTGLRMQTNRYSVSERTRGMEMGHQIHLLNDRLTLIPGYGLLSVFSRMQGDGTSIDQLDTSVSVTSFSLAPADIRTSADGLFIRLGMDYQISEGYQLVALVRYLPDGIGEWTQQSNSLALGYSSSVDYFYQLTVADIRGKSNRRMGSLDLKLVREVNSFFQVNVGAHWQYSSTRYSVEPTRGAIFTAGTGGFSSLTGSSYVYLGEPLSDAKIYSHRKSENRFNLYLSMTFTTGEQNL